ncbi:MAG TPA: Crp/Fnr family transcriptional regulator [Steroidobacteraceae bacterium]
MDNFNTVSPQLASLGSTCEGNATLHAPVSIERYIRRPRAAAPLPAPTPGPRDNQLLAALCGTEYARLAAHLERVHLERGASIHEPGGMLQHAYFPASAIVSLQCFTESGASAEVAGVGNEGIVGVSLFMGGDAPPSAAVVQTAGDAYRLERRLLAREFDDCGELRRLLLRYTQALFAQMAQTAVCNRHHSIEQQLCRWLLATLDRVPSGILYMTQELLASLLGVRREGVSEAAGKLQQAGFIRYRRGRIAVLDRSGLERRACECYGVVKEQFARLLSDTSQTDALRVAGQPNG